MPEALEYNFDGIVGPTHNYAGLSHGNLASSKNKLSVSNPRAAALEGLAKMRWLADIGVPQAVLPPHERPHVPTLRRLGFSGTDAQVIERLQTRLKAPGGLYRIWWHVRTNFVETRMVMQRLLALRNALERGALRQARWPTSTFASRPRNKWRPSANCHAIRPGMPNASSRTRRIKANESAISGGKPSTLPSMR